MSAPIDDSFRGLGRALEHALTPPDERGPAPVACCPRDGDPLVATVERPKAEFHCLTCGGWFGYLAPTPGEPTPELLAQTAQVRERFDAGERGPSSEAGR